MTATNLVFLVAIIVVGISSAAVALLLQHRRRP